ncbi:MAG: SoxR reducing system RseC family protein [Prevotellaceae bacterium]|jgi:hypothetical protein|nr:SoxR reducing system RseC family protein [Prevotellaceae bacterium]
MSQKISHAGVVKAIEDDRVLVSFKISEEEALALGVDTDYSLMQLPLGLHQLSVDEPVNVVMKPSFGKKAVALLYMLPAVILVACLSLLLSVGLAEGAAGLSSLGVVALYYAALYFCRGKLSREYSYHIEKIQ